MLQKCLSKMRKFIANSKVEYVEAALYAAAWDYVDSLAQEKREKLWNEIILRESAGFSVYNPKSNMSWGVEVPQGAMDIRDHIIAIVLLDLWLLPHGPTRDW